VPQTPRVPPVDSRDQLDDDQRHHYDAIAESRGYVRGPFPVLLHSPPAAGLVADLGAYVRFESVLDEEIRELAILTTARERDCAYEWAAHEPYAREVGVREAAIDAVAHEADELGSLSDDEALVIRFARATLAPGEMPEELFKSALDRFDRRGVADLTVTVGYYSMIAGVLNAFAVRPDDPVEEF